MAAIARFLAPPPLRSSDGYDSPSSGRDRRAITPQLGAHASVLLWIREVAVYHATPVGSIW